MKELRFHGQAIVTGRGSIAFLKNIDMKRVFLVCGGSSVFKNGILDKVKALLSENKCEIRVFSGVPQNPSTTVVAEGIAAMRQFRADAVIGLGGGSAIDAAKAMSLFYDYPELDLETAFRQGIPQERKTVKLIAIPSTSGTAAEVTPFAVLTFKQENLKVGAKSSAFVPDYSILDAAITLSMPANVAAETGMDAMAHAVECYTNNNLDDFSECLAAGAIEGLFKYLPVSCKTADPVAREKVHNYQSMAGCAFANVGTGMDHGIAHAMGGKYDLGHGLLIAVALPYVLEFNSRDAEVKAKLDYLARRIGQSDFVKAVRKLNLQVGIPVSFKALGIAEADFNRDLDGLVENSLKGSTKANPVPVTEDAMKSILRRIYEGE